MKKSLNKGRGREYEKQVGNINKYQREIEKNKIREREQRVIENGE